MYVEQLGCRGTGYRFRVTWVLVVPLLLVLASVPVLAQPVTTAPAAPASPLDGKMIRDLTISGLEQIDESYIRNQMRTRVGQPYSQNEMQEDISRLLRTTRFLDVRAEPELVDGQINLELVVAEKPEVQSVEFVGAEEFKPKDLLKELRFAPGDPLDLFEVRQGQDTIARLYKEKGYAYVDVTYDAELLKTERRVVYTIVENQRVRVRKVRFDGNVAYDKRELKGQIETKSYIPIFRTGDFDPDRAMRDATNVQQYYRDRGFLDAEVSYIEEFLDVAREKLQLTFRVNEGTRYTVSDIRIRGNAVFSEDELLGVMQLKIGDYLIASRLQLDLKALQTEYGSNGYIEAQVTHRTVFAEEPGQVIVEITVEEGQQFGVGWIEINGHSHTQEKVVRRELRFYPEEIYDVTKTEKAEKRLKGTGLFSEATISPVVPPDQQANVRDVLVTVEESAQTSQFIAGVSASADAGLFGNIVLENKNFDIGDWPRNWGEFLRGKAFRGAGQTMRMELRPGTEFTEFRIDFREPYFLDKPIGFSVGASLFERGRDGYDERRGGGYFSFDKRFEDGLLKGWGAELAFRAEYVGVEDVESFAAKDIRDVEGGNYLSTAKFTLAHDTTDSRFDPTEGHRVSFAWEQAGAMGGDFFYAKLTGGAVRHWTLAIDDEDRRSVFSVRGRAGQILGDAPVFERFYAGGISSMRGFDFRGISPRDGLRKNRIGGDFMLLTGAEYSFPLYTKVIRGVFFFDMGTVEPNLGINTWRAALGGGIRLTLPIFGTVPMEFDLAIPVSKDGDDDTRIFSFFIGLPFF